MSDIFERVRQVRKTLNELGLQAQRGNQVQYQLLEDLTEEFQESLKQAKKRNPQKHHHQANSKANSFVAKYYNLAWMEWRHPGFNENRYEGLKEVDTHRPLPNSPLPAGFDVARLSEPSKENISDWSEAVMELVKHYHPLNDESGNPLSNSVPVQLLLSDNQKEQYRGNYREGLPDMKRRIEEIFRRYLLPRIIKGRQ